MSSFSLRWRSACDWVLSGVRLTEHSLRGPGSQAPLFPDACSGWVFAREVATADEQGPRSPGFWFSCAAGPHSASEMWRSGLVVGPLGVDEAWAGKGYRRPRKGGQT